MPPKPRFTREEIVEAALALVSKQGVEHLTARELAARLGTSAQPIFTVFADMNEVRGAVYAAASQRMGEYVHHATEYTHSFKQAGMQIVYFAMEEPKLFQLLLMTEVEGPTGFEEMLETRGGSPERFVSLVSEVYGLTREQAKALFKHIWIYTYGIGVLCATKMCTFTDEELPQIIGADFMAMLNYIKEGHIDDPTPVPKHIS